MPMAGFLFFPWIAAFFGGLVVNVASYFVNKFSIRAAIVLSIITLTIAFSLAVQTIMLTIQVSMPVVIQDGIDLLPSNTNVCMTAFFTNYVAAWVYHHHKNLISVQG